MREANGRRAEFPPKFKGKYFNLTYLVIGQAKELIKKFRHGN